MRLFSQILLILTLQFVPCFAQSVTLRNENWDSIVVEARKGNDVDHATSFGTKTMRKTDPWRIPCNAREGFVFYRSHEPSNQWSAWTSVGCTSSDNSSRISDGGVVGGGTAPVAQTLLAGGTCRIQFPTTSEDDHLGTIARGTPYTIQYDGNSGKWTVTGYAACRGRGNSQSAAYPGPPPSGHQLVFWGAPFTFTDDGALTSEATTAADGCSGSNSPSTGRHLVGTISCPR
jgi:hypothetical protein